MKLIELPNSVESCWLAIVAGTPHLGQNVLLYSRFVLNLNDDLHFLRLGLQQAAVGGSPEKVFANEALAPLTGMQGN